MILNTLLTATLITANPQLPPLPWFGEDKLKHFFASFVVSSISASGARVAGLDHSQSIYVGVGVGAASGVYKEIQDSRRGGAFSGYDLMWDAAGVGSAAFLLESSR